MTENTENNPPIEDTKENPELSLSPETQEKSKKVINEDDKKQKIVNSKYLLDKLNKEKLNKLKEEQEKEIKQQCTFKPAINTNYKLKDWKTESQSEESKEGSSNNSSKVKTPHEEALERMKFWTNKSQTKIEKERAKHVDKEVEHCSFAPTINKEMPEFQDKYIKGTKIFLQRQMKSKQQKNEINNKLNPNYDQLYHNLFKKKEKKVVNKNLKSKDYQAALDILHNELISK